MSLSYRKDLRRSQTKHPLLPYEVGWEENVWIKHGADHRLHGPEGELFEFGLFVGRRCSELWDTVWKCVQQHPVPVLVTAVIAQVNISLLSLTTHHLNSVKKMNHSTPLSTIDALSELLLVENHGKYEQLLNVLSDFLFALIKHRRLPSTSLIIPDIAMQNREISASAAKILRDVTKIAYFKFCFDLALFADAQVARVGNAWDISPSATKFGKLFLERSAISSWRDQLSHIEMEQNARSRHYNTDLCCSLVKKVKVSERKIYASFCSGEENIKTSRLLPFVGYIGTGYLFDTLLEYKDTSDIVNTWDFLHSLSTALQYYANETHIVENFVSDIQRDHLIEGVTIALRVSRSRARKAVEALTFDKPCDDGIWSCPIVPTDRQYVAICHPAIQTNSPTRLLSQIIKNRNLSSRRGAIFERKCLQEIDAKELTRPVGKRRYQVLKPPHSIFNLIGTKKLQTDFIIKAGFNIIVCEAKSTAHVATAREFWRAYEAFEKGARQLAARTNRIHERIEDSKKLLGLQGEQDIVVGQCIITNSVFFDGVEIERIPIVSLRTLVTFIREKINDEVVGEQSFFNVLQGYLHNPEHLNNLSVQVEIEQGFIKAPDHAWEVRYEFSSAYSRSTAGADST